ncbi:protein SPA1-RELATED 3 isoform X1 [Physcomitrium patens]|uniref:Uncharacterized protein n=2 Tax=Physcomitrium patens TaxID=3218 RepID=A0A7I4BZM0_PHYPA|nr:WD repeat-containing protein RUP2-like isoform X1 [Physcomitrium patens]|eukprot:XP_024394565.1 WD repeat-containing protein RUP2-like isoform X1 [Physcomitrella patens]
MESPLLLGAPSDHFLEGPSSGDNVVGATASLLDNSRLPMHDSLGSSLDRLCRFSFRKTLFKFDSTGSRFKRRKVSLEEQSTGAISPPHSIKLKILGVDTLDPHDEKKAAQQISIWTVDRAPTHAILSNGSKGHRNFSERAKVFEFPMLPGTSPPPGDATAEEGRCTRPASMPNLRLGESRLAHSFSKVPLEVDIPRDNIKQTLISDAQGKSKPLQNGAVSCGSTLQSICGGNGEGSVIVSRQHCHGEDHRSSWDFKVVASVKSQNRNLTSTDVIGTIAFEKTNEYFATGGIARKIRVYSYSQLVSGVSSTYEDEDEDEDEEESLDYLKQRRLRKRRASTSEIDHARCCVQEVCTPAKLSSLQWYQERPNLIACGDYDGVVAEWDLERNCTISERDENGGQRIWSIDYSKDFPNLIASASDDGTVRIWDRNSEQSAAILSHPTYSPICCAEFGPVSSSLIALASADSNVYLYDTRWLSTPLLTLAHHKRAASYVRFLTRHSLVSSSIDSSVKLWDITSLSSTSERAASVIYQHCDTLVKSFGSHYNVRNFTGLSVRSEGGLIACGSETNQAFVYDSQTSNPILMHSFDYKPTSSNMNPILGSWSSDRLASKESLKHSEGDTSNSLIVSAVCWRTKSNDCTLVAANSDGVLRVLSGSQSREIN